MTNQIKLFALLMLAMMTFSCQKEETVDPQKPLTTQTNRVSKSAIEKYRPVGLNQFIHFFTNGLVLDSHGRVLKGTIAYDTDIKVATAGNHFAKFKGGKKVYFDANVVGVVGGFALSSDVVHPQGNPNVSLTLKANSYVTYSNNPSYLGVWNCVLGKSHTLENQDGTSTKYRYGRELYFNKKGQVHYAMPR
ncbi:hypothetical protein [Microscilla marina]|uniref:Lipoprotein, putative n=1 Tax=Microscilla marina ATCC 23134 TaxID=313606 RepID=A1ZJD9_MICM2|nr:hypothetical protein [Microscilla marina]EAY29675.1 lipoprotein, putative [Microscilla marina ATCC 23134]